MKHTLIFVVLIMLLIGCSNTNVQKDIDVNTAKNQHNTYCLNKIINNFHLYKDEERLFEGIEIEEFDLNRMALADTLLIFNFEKGTMKKVKRSFDYTGYYIKGFPTEETVTGDFSGNGKKGTSTITDCDTVINLIFSDRSIPNLELWGRLGYTIKNEGDILNNGKDVIGFLPAAGSGRFYHVVSLINNEWVELIEIALTKDMLATGIIPIEKDTEQKDKIIIRFAGTGDSNNASYVVEKLISVEELERGIWIDRLN